MQNIESKVLECFIQIHEASDSHSILKSNRNGHIEIPELFKLIQKYDPSIIENDLTIFITKVLKELKFTRVTQFVLDTIFKKAAKQKQKKQMSQNWFKPFQILTRVEQAIIDRGLSIDKVFQVFDRDKDAVLNENEFYTFLEYYFPLITEIEYKYLRKKYSNPEIDKALLLSWVSESKALLPNKIQPDQLKAQPTPQPVKHPGQPQQLPNSQIEHKPVQIASQTSPTTQPSQTMSQADDNTISNEQPLLQEKSAQIPTTNQKKELKAKLARKVLTRKPRRRLGQKMIQNKGVGTKVVAFKNILMNHHISGLQEFTTLFKQLEQSQQQYTDNSFPANKVSLGPRLKEYKWNRISTIWGDKHSVFQKSQKRNDENTFKDWISPDDIAQGELGDCYLLSALSSVALQQPEIISELLITQTVNKAGIYAVKLCVDGVWQLIVMDDLIPVIGNKPAFSQSKSFESWALLLEKAWAKLHGSYSNVIGGQSTEVLKCITSGPTWTYNSDSDHFMAKFQDAFQKNCIMTVGTNRPGSNYETVGLIQGHAYSILSLHKVTHPELGDLQIVKLRNPWGQTEWNGQWSDNCPLWTSELKKELEFVNEDDGVFYMNYADFIHYYKTIFVGSFKQHFVYSSLKQSIKSNKSQYFEFTILKDGEYYFTAYQKTERQFRGEYQQYEYSQIRLLLAKVDNDEFIYIDSACQNLDNLFVGGQLSKGTYIVQVKINWNYWDEYSYNVSMYGELAIDLSQVEEEFSFVENVMLSRAKLNENYQEVYQDNPLIVNSSEINSKLGFGYEYFKNNSEVDVEVDLNLAIPEGFKMLKPYREIGDKVMIPSQGEQIIVFVYKQEHSN